MLRSPNRALWWVIGGGVVFLGLILYVPLLRVLFRFSFLHPEDLAITLIAGIFSILWFEGFKLWNRRKKTAIAIFLRRNLYEVCFCSQSKMIVVLLLIIVVG